MSEQMKNAYPVSWIGLKPARFRKYRTWINAVKPGICGTYVGAVILHDAFNQKYGIDLSKEKLITGLKTIIDDTFVYKGTFPWDVWHGLNWVLKGNQDFKVKMHFVPERKVVALLNRKKPIPVAVGTATLFGSPYKNHWLVVYAYGYNEEGKLFFKAYDNHGRYKAIIPASQTIGCVWIEATV
ncbi:dihydrolipoamide dehydrogenase [Carnobacterium sp. ISL-102]|uniref:dihydrolipoamide dehydrogenase n=1 Tax=Carnobacterium sp. ISL-102 TaxID=2819142 RepID=UPI001BEBA46C|nr:dihydrolipoamide dehydrogenase [Carnobacterium sp. ISL-102]MBT2730995.1 dihydrolipoamide dehydrogenase [Carnobacterium sp. ISL-102]